MQHTHIQQWLHSVIRVNATLAHKKLYLKVQSFKQIFEKRKRCWPGDISFLT